MGVGRTIREGAALLWRRQRPLWWLFGANAVLGAFSAVIFSQPMAAVLDRSLRAEQLYKEFDLLAFAELLGKPQVAMGWAFNVSLLLSLAFFLLVLFATGGILEGFYTDRHLDSAEFFAARGRNFWRFVRLTILFVVPAAAVAIVAQALHRAWTRVSGGIDAAGGPFWPEIATFVLLILIAWALRTWFDVAQVHAVAQDETSAVRSLRATWIAFRGVFASIVAIHFIAGLVVTLLALTFIKAIPATGNGLRLLVGELAIVFLLACRLWQRACEVVWYQRAAAVPCREGEVAEMVSTAD